MESSNSYTCEVCLKPNRYNYCLTPWCSRNKCGWCNTAPINERGHYLTPKCRNKDDCQCHSPRWREYQKEYDDKVLEYKVSEFDNVTFL